MRDFAALLRCIGLFFIQGATLRDDITLATISRASSGDTAAQRHHRDCRRGCVLARSWAGVDSWPVASLLAWWPSLGGHWIEVGFLNGLRPRISAARGVQLGARVMVWLVGGIGLAIGMGLTAKVLAGFRRAHGSAWWLAGAGFICIELIAHLALQVRGRLSFYNGRG